MPHNEPFVTLDHVSKQYATVTAVDDLSFAIEPGEIYALLGPNGAGKTTLVRMLVGILQPDSGTVGFAAGLDRRLHVGYLPEERGLYPDQPILRTLEYFGTLYRMPAKEAREAALAWLERLDLADRAQEKLDALSKGNQQKVQFVSAVLHRPRLLILDEPFSGLDPLNQELFLDLIEELRREGATILLSAHQMNLVEAIADRILVIDHGRPALHGTMAEIRARAASREKIICRVPDDCDVSAVPLPDGIRHLETLPGGEVAAWLAPDAALPEALAALAAALPIIAVNSAQVSLHEIFVETVGRREEVTA